MYLPDCSFLKAQLIRSYFAAVILTLLLQNAAVGVMLYVYLQL
jgi:hypothetical protein